MKLFYTLTCLLFLSACANNHQQNINRQLAGMYKLLRVEAPNSSGNWQQEDWAIGGDSYILYDGKGHMATQIIPKDYKNFQWLKEADAINKNKVQQKIDSMNIDELRAVVKELASCYTYVADYFINDDSGIITHQRLASSIPDVWNTDVQRGFVFSGDTLILTTNFTTHRRLVWLRQN